MKRRQFLKMTSLAGLGALLPFVPRMELFAAQNDYSGPLWLTINAVGGWDPTSFCDPKGYRDDSDASNPLRINNYNRADIGTIGRFRFAPPPNDFQPGQRSYNPKLYSAEKFFTRHFQELLVINGIDCRTIAHSDGQLHTWGGRLIKGYPCFSALAAGVLAPERALAFLTNGGYSNTADLVPPTKIDSQNRQALFELAYVNQSVPPRSMDIRQYYPDNILSLIDASVAQRLDTLRSTQYLPNIQDSMEKHAMSRTGTERLKDFANNLASFSAFPNSFFNGRKKAISVYEQGCLAMAAYQAGVATSANISLGGFDTHVKHDEVHYPLLMDLLQGIDAILLQAQELGLSDRVVLVMGSDFGRMNRFNKDRGKDHWPISSMMFIGNNTQRIRGNRVLGETTDTLEAIALDPVTLRADYNEQNPAAIRLTPSHIHQALRRLAGIANSAAAQRFPLMGEELMLFG